ncbi:DUF6777 domain-containing protein [Streptomyces sp. NPDC097610]|uniref:DUF6777 domain-containing protein n=1 Tax=Streptomyces sp. NPDC097610 TaxID=3157227 RepID=UPI003330B170
MVHIPARALVMACALSAALLVAGCGGRGGESAASRVGGGEVFLQPVTGGGPDPFTASTAADSPFITRMPYPATPANRGSAPQGVRFFPGSTPGLYGGTRAVGSCDVGKQTGLLSSDPGKARSFAQAAGVAQAAVPDFLRGLTSVVLRADTQVTDHGFRDGRATSFQSVLQRGTAVLVDNRGVPRVRCAGGNPLSPPVVSRTTPGTQGQPWSGFRPGNVVVVTPASAAIRNITIIDIADNRWIERRIGDDGHRDVVLRPPVSAASPGRRPDASPGTSLSASPGTSPGTSPSTVPEHSPRTGPLADVRPPDCVAPTLTVTPEGTPGMPDGGVPAEAPVAAVSNCLPPTTTAPPPASPTPRPDISLPPLVPWTPAPDSTEIDRNVPQDPLAPLDPSEDEIGPDTVPEIPDLPDGGGLIPDESPDADTVFDTPTDVFNG